MIFREVPLVAQAGAVLAAGAATGGAFGLRQIYKNLTGNDELKRREELRLQRTKPLRFRPFQTVVEEIAHGSLPKADDFDSRAMALELLLIHRPERFFDIALNMIGNLEKAGKIQLMKDIQIVDDRKYIQKNEFMEQIVDEQKYKYNLLSEAFKIVKTYQTKESRQTTIQKLKAIAVNHGAHHHAAHAHVVGVSLDLVEDSRAS